MSHTLNYFSRRRDSLPHWLVAEVQRFVPYPGRWWGYYMAAARVLDSSFEAERIGAQLRVARLSRSEWTFTPDKDLWQAWVAVQVAEGEKHEPGVGQGILVSRVLRCTPPQPQQVTFIDSLPKTYPHPKDAFLQLIEINPNRACGRIAP